MTWNQIKLHQKVKITSGRHKGAHGVVEQKKHGLIVVRINDSLYPRVEVYPKDLTPAPE